MRFEIRESSEGHIEITSPAGSDRGTWRDALRGWQAGNGDSFSGVLAALPWSACFWECPPLTHSHLDTPFESVALAAPALAAPAADPVPFGKHFQTTPAAVSFSNLGHDARLIAPTPTSDEDAAHLLAFTRSASRDRQRALWRVVADQVARRLGAAPLWLSTSGLGVAWLHVRLDRVPKYYQHRPYRELRPPGR